MHKAQLGRKVLLPHIPMTAFSGVRKRKRPTIVCLRCRAKKAKCDKGKPCLKCIKAKCPEKCVYGTEEKSNHSPSSSSSVPLEWAESIEKHVTLSNTAFKLSEDFGTTPTSTPNHQLIIENNDLLVGINPVVRSTDMINIHMDLQALKAAMSTQGMSRDSSQSNIKFKCIKNSTRIIGVVEISQQEPGAQLFWNLNENNKKLKLLTIQNFSDHRLRMQLQEETRQAFGDKYIDLYPYGFSNISSNSVIRRQFARYGTSIGLSYLPDFELREGDPYETALLSLLPLRLALLAYVDRFFNKIYPVFPVVDQEWLLAQIDRLLVYSPDGSTLLQVSISSKDDLMILAILVFALRMAYLSFLTNVRAQNEEILNAPQEWGLTLAQSEISLTMVDLGSRLLASGNFRKKPLILNFQAHLLGAVTKMYALENQMSFNIQDTDCNVGQLVHMATTLNLDRDPDFVRDNLRPDEKSNNLRRKLWYVLVHLDYIISYLFLSPKFITLTQYNTKPPRYSPNASNISDQTVEEETIRLMKTLHEVVCAGSDLLDICLDLRKSHRAIDVICKLNDFEMLIKERLGTILSYFEGTAPHSYSTFSLTVFQIQTQVLLKLFLANVYYFLHLYYCYQNDVELDFFFFKKLSLILCHELRHLCPELMFSKYAVADPTFNLFMSPAILVYAHVVAIVGVGFILRIHCTILIIEWDKLNEEGLKVLRELTLRSKNFTTRKLKLCKLLSERYFYGWKCTKANGYGYKIIYDNQTYSGDLDALTKAKMSWSPRHQMEILNLIPDADTIQFPDVSDIDQHCYFSSHSLDDAALYGLDLFKTIQTDNFWITFNAIYAQDSYAAGFSKGKELQPEAPEIVPGVGTIVNYEQSVPPLGDATPGPDLPRFDPSRPDPPGAEMPRPEIPIFESEFPELIGPPSYDNVDLNFFSTDWTIDEFYPLN